jgi:phosphatidylinositol alpha-1,6-mannosyltransferase
VPDEELAQFYRSSSVFLMPSRLLPDQADVEGFGIVFLEAGAAGLPVIAGRSGGISDAVIDGVTGYLTDPEDIASLTAKVSALLANRTLRQRMGYAARCRVLREFTWDRVSERYLNL